MYRRVAICLRKKGPKLCSPTPPGPPEPQCPEGWRKIRDRCLYLSSDSSQTAANWTEARAMCKGFHEGSNLVSIRDQTDQDAFNGMCITLNCRYEIMKQKYFKS